jgi:succinate dehydrogenase hydrophobic anchor subunit
MTQGLVIVATILYFAALGIWGLMETYQLSKKTRFSMRALMILMTVIATVLGFTVALSRWTG